MTCNIMISQMTEFLTKCLKDNPLNKLYKNISDKIINKRNFKKLKLQKMFIIMIKFRYVLLIKWNTNECI